MKAKRILTFLLVAVMTVALFSACTSGPETETSTPNNAAPAVTNTTPAGAADPGETEEQYSYKMPITDDVYTITMWRPFSSTLPCNLVPHKPSGGI